MRSGSKSWHAPPTHVTTGLVRGTGPSEVAPPRAHTRRSSCYAVPRETPNTPLVAGERGTLCHHPRSLYNPQNKVLGATLTNPSDVSEQRKLGISSCTGFSWSQTNFSKNITSNPRDRGPDRVDELEISSNSSLHALFVRRDAETISENRVTTFRSGIRRGCDSGCDSRCGSL
jgi:hypothetical protein